MYENYDYGCNDDYDCGYGDDYVSNFMLPPRPYKPLKATKRNVEEEISYMLNVPMFNIKFVKLDDLPEIADWKHSCFISGITKMNTGCYPFDDGSLVYVAVCPFFPKCNVVHYYVERNY